MGWKVAHFIVAVCLWYINIRECFAREREIETGRESGRDNVPDMMKSLK